MFIKCASIILYIISIAFLVFFSFQYSIESWNEGNTQNFVFLMMLIVLLIILIVIACFNLSTTFKAWRDMKDYKNDVDQIID